jgi:hypothetical protein
MKISHVWLIFQNKWLFGIEKAALSKNDFLRVNAIIIIFF